MRLLIAVVVGLSVGVGSSGALADTTSLTSSVELADLPPRVAIAERASAKTTTARFRERTTRPTSNVDLVLIVRLEPINSPDRVTVAKAVRRGSRIVISIEVRRFMGPLAGNDVTEPFVEVELGQLAAGTYDVRVDAMTFEFDDFEHPETAVKQRSELGTRMSFQVK